MSKRPFLISGFLIIALAIAGLACNSGTQPSPTPASTAVPPILDDQNTPSIPTAIPSPVSDESADAVQAATYALAVFLGRDPNEFGLVSAQPTQFVDTALGCPRPGETVTQAQTPGYTIILSNQNDGRQYELHTSPDGLRVRCLSEDLRPAAEAGSTGIMATISALENREYGTLASLLPETVNLAAYPDTPQALASSSFIAQLRDIWLGPGSVQIDLNTNVLALMPSLELPPSHIPVFSTGWSATRDTDGILLFNVSGQPPVLSQIIFISSSQKETAYSQPAPAEPGEEITSTLTAIYQGPDFSIAYPKEWFTSTVANSINFQPPGENVAIVVEPWTSGTPPREEQNLRTWLESTAGDVFAGFESVNSLDPIWAVSGQPGYLFTWNQRRADGVLESSNPVAFFDRYFAEGETEYFALAVFLLEPERKPEFLEMIASLEIQQTIGVPSDMNIYRHDTLGYRIQFPADWKLLPSPLGAAFQPPDQDVAITIGPWPMTDGPAAGQSFEDWVANAPAQNIQGYGQIQQISPVEATGGDAGFLATWQVSLPDGNLGESDPTAVFPFQRQLPGEDRTYHALAIGLHNPDYGPDFQRMIATLVIENQSTAEMIYIPAGPFVRGSNDGQISAWTSACGGGCRGDEFTDEGPQRTITLNAFYIDRTEVTVAQFKEFAQASGYLTTAEQKGDPVQFTWRAFDFPDRQDHPVRWLSWDDANAFCQWAGQRLPTEAEWEKAARGEDGRTWPWGDNWDDSMVPHGDTASVEAYPQAASPYGVLGMAGGVWEWVADWYGATYYGAAPDTDPTGPASSPDKVLRGGSFNNSNWAMRTAHRHYGGPQGYSLDHGFRCASDG